MLEALLPFPNIDPVLIHLGPFAIRWYALAYIAGLLLGWWAISRMLRQKSLWTNPPFNGKPPATPDDIGDLVVWATFGVIVGGRLGWVLFYGIALCSVSPDGAMCHGLPMGFLTDPIRIVAAWDGGMSFHGGLIGMVTALWLFTRRRGLKFVQVGDLVASVTPIGLFFGRIANFVNGELWGKPTDVPWAMIFPHAPDQLPRHPSQLYEAALEGIVLFIVLQVGLRVFRWHERPGLLAGTFFLLYGLFRAFVEIFREPDAPFWGPVSMGQALSFPMFAVAAFFFWYAFRKQDAKAGA
jgi:phosphatidylglycerol:prolipoprotein diacylglycerol transferase